MSGDRRVVLEITRLEAAHLTQLLLQFTDLLAGSGSEAGATPPAPAVARLVPDAYADDPEASREFRDLTSRELLDHRTADANAVLRTLAVRGRQLDPAALKGDAAQELSVSLDDESLRAWLRTLTALRLVLASRLDIRTEQDHDDDDPRFGIYDWLGYRLDGLIRAVDES